MNLKLLEVLLRVLPYLAMAIGEMLKLSDDEAKGKPASVGAAAFGRDVEGLVEVVRSLQMIKGGNLNTLAAIYALLNDDDFNSLVEDIIQTVSEAVQANAPNDGILANFSNSDWEAANYYEQSLWGALRSCKYGGPSRLKLDQVKRGITESIGRAIRAAKEDDDTLNERLKSSTEKYLEQVDATHRLLGMPEHGGMLDDEPERWSIETTANVSQPNIQTALDNLSIGDPCPVYGCVGVMDVRRVDPCICHTGNPPCSACTDAPLLCSECGFNPDADDLDELNRLALDSRPECKLSRPHIKYDEGQGHD